MGFLTGGIEQQPPYPWKGGITTSGREVKELLRREADLIDAALKWDDVACIFLRNFH